MLAGFFMLNAYMCDAMRIDTMGRTSFQSMQELRPMGAGNTLNGSMQTSGIFTHSKPSGD
jgi:hypothetical protein